MRELLVRTVSGVVLAIVLLACVLISPWTFAALLLLIVIVGTYEMTRLQQLDSLMGVVVSEVFSIGTFALPALDALQVVGPGWLLLELLILMIPFLFALFSVRHDAKSIFTCLFASLTFLSLPSALMLFMYCEYLNLENLFGVLKGAYVIIPIFCLLWINDIFAYLTGKLFGKHKLFPRISPGKTIEGCVGGLVFTVMTMVIFIHYTSWLPMAEGIGLAVIAVVFGTLGDLCESMLKRQAGVKDSGNLIPGHGGILDRFDSVMFSVPFIFVYLQLL